MAGKIPQQFIDDLLSRVDIVDVIEADLPLKKSGKDFHALCPFHGEKTPSFTISQEKQFYHCFGCGAHGSAIGFVMNHRGLSFVEAVEELAQLVGLNLPEREDQQTPAVDYSHLYRVLEQAQDFFSAQLRAHPARGRAVDYLKSRGLTGQIAKRFGIGYAPDAWDGLLNAIADDGVRKQHLVEAGLAITKDENRCYDRFRDRITFPIYDRRGRVVGFGGRIIDRGEPKYLNSPETPVFQKRRELYGLYQIRQSQEKTERILVVEGYMDVVALAQFGVHNAVATLGTATTTDQLELLFRASAEIVFCFDGDNAGRRAAWRALEVTLPLLKSGRQVSFMFLPEGHDPDSFVREQGAAAFQHPDHFTPLSDFLFDELADRGSLKTLDGRARFVDAAKPLLDKIPEGSFKQMMQQRLAEIGKIDPSSVVSPRRTSARSAPALRSRSAQRRPSVVRTALKRALLFPTLAQQCGELDVIKTNEDTGVDLLCEILESAQQNPGITTGGLLEHYRGTNYERPLAELLAEPLELDEASEAQTFHAALEKLRAKAQKALARRQTEREFESRTKSAD